MVSSSSTTLRAGRALADISPAPGTALAGDVGVRRPAETFLDPLLAKVLVLECGGTRLCILALDITIMTARYSAAIRAGAAERFGLEPHAVMIHATQHTQRPVPVDFCWTMTCHWGRSGIGCASAMPLLATWL